MQMEWYIHLRYFPTDDCLEFVVLHCDGVVTTLANLLLMEIVNKRRPPYMWEEFRIKMI